jgi:hypothetical protein
MDRRTTLPRPSGSRSGMRRDEFISGGPRHLVRAIPGLLWLHCQTKCHVRRAIECLKQMVARQAPELPESPGFRLQLDAPIARLALGAGDVGLPHARQINIERAALPACFGRRHSLTSLNNLIDETECCGVTKTEIPPASNAKAGGEIRRRQATAILALTLFAASTMSAATVSGFEM